MRRRAFELSGPASSGCSALRAPPVAGRAGSSFQHAEPLHVHGAVLVENAAGMKAQADSAPASGPPKGAMFSVTVEWK